MSRRLNLSLIALVALAAGLVVGVRLCRPHAAPRFRDEGALANAVRGKTANEVRATLGEPDNVQSDTQEGHAFTYWSYTRIYWSDRRGQYTLVIVVFSGDCVERVRVHDGDLHSSQ